jgi:phage shock protein C
MNETQERTKPSAGDTLPHAIRWDRLEARAFPARPRRRLYRSRKGWVFGVCKGLADYAELPVFWIRLILVALTVLSWVLPFAVLYVVAAFWMKPEPVLEAEAAEDWKAYSNYACHQSQRLAQLKEELDRVETLTLRLERQASARQFDWEQRFRERP